MTRGGGALRQPANRPLPDGFVVKLEDRVRALEAGVALLGGSPTRLIRLTARSAALIQGRRVEVSGPASRALCRRLIDLGLAHHVVEAPSRSGDLDPGAVTIVVPVFNATTSLERLLASVVMDPVASRCGVLVVDDGSHDHSALARVCAGYGARVARLEVNRGPAAARNEGLRHAQTPLVAFVDADVVFVEPVLGRLAAQLDDPMVAVAAPRVRGLSNPGQTWVQRYEDVASSLDMGPDPASVRPGSTVGWVPAACLVARRDALGDGFDESLRTGEDVDLVWRLCDAGWRIAYDPAVSVGHAHRRRVRDLAARKFAYGLSGADLALRHGQAVAPAVVAWWHLSLLAVPALPAPWAWRIPLGTIVVVWSRIAWALRSSASAPAVGAELTIRATLGLGHQARSLLLRHWWPLAALACLWSSRMRWFMAAAVSIDAVADHARRKPDLDLARHLVLRRVDEFSYGGGLWVGALRRRCVTGLLPAFRFRSSR